MHASPFTFMLSVDLLFSLSLLFLVQADRVFSASCALI